MELRPFDVVYEGWLAGGLPEEGDLRMDVLALPQVGNAVWL